LPSPRLLAASVDFLNGTDADSFEPLLHRDGSGDGLALLGASSVRAALVESLGTEDVSEWILRPVTWDVREYGRAKNRSTADTFLLLLWQDLEGRLQRKFDSLFRRTRVADSGAVLCFFGLASLSVVVEYRRAPGGPVRLRPVAVVLEPRGLFELSNILVAASPEQANALKAAVLSVDKIVYQRDILVHVDRQQEDVFGPSIDTVILAELVADALSAARLADLSALEVGAGSGLLTTTIASSESVQSITAVDVNPAAISCTMKNLRINSVDLNSQRPAVSVRGERFCVTSFVAPFDVVVCNPPYIPEPEASRGSVKDFYATAVGGLELCEEILKNIDSLLSPGGRLLFMTSSTSAREVLQHLPSGFLVSAASTPLRVPLDVETVWRRPDWQRSLLDEGKIERDEQGALWHRLEPVWIEREH
jgi:release factor glutamine methyltransferase